MRGYWVLLAIIATARAQQDVFAELPACAARCIAEALPSTNCVQTDIPCLCASRLLWPGASPCGLSNCTILESLAASKVAADTCGLPVRNRSNTYAYTTASFCVVSMILVIIRLVACQMKFHLDDGMLVLAWLGTIPGSVLGGFIPKYGMGRDIWQVPQDTLYKYFFTVYLAVLFFFLGTALVKVALLTFYIRIFPSRKFRIVVWIMVGFIVLWGACTTLIVVFQCSPISYTWLQWDGQHTGKCLPLANLILAHAALTMLSDLAILVLPIPTLYKLHVNWKKKLQIFSKRPLFFRESAYGRSGAALSRSPTPLRMHTLINGADNEISLVMFNFGMLVIIVSALRFHELFHMLDSRNPTWDYFDPGIWSSAELNISIVCACLPATKVLAERSFTRLSSKWSARLGSSPSGGSSQPTKQPMRRPSSAKLTPISTNRISLRTSISVSSPQERRENEQLCYLGFHPWDHVCGNVSGSCSARSRTVITAGELPPSPWPPKDADPTSLERPASEYPFGSRD